MLRDLRYAARALRKTPSFTLPALAALALGIGANCAIFSVVDAVLLARLPYADPSRLYEIGGVENRGAPAGASLAGFVALRDHNQSFSRVSVDRFWSSTLTDRFGDAERLYGRALSADTLPLLGVQPRLGRIFRGDDYRPGAPHVVLLSTRLWKRRYSADPLIIGATIDLDSEAYTVIGVMPDEFQFPFAAYDVWTPWIFSPAELANRKGRIDPIYARLRPGVTFAQAQAELDAFAHAAAAQFPDTEKDWQPRLVPTKLGSRDQYRAQLLTLSAAVGFVLLIACLNVANLLLARAASRRREIAVRIALGATRGRLIRQLLTESLLLALSGAALAAVFGSWSARALFASLPVSALRQRFTYGGLNAHALLFTLALAILSAIVFGLAPAIQLSRADLHRGLKNSRARFRGALLAAETALSLLLLVGAGLMIRSLEKLLSVDPGFRAENVLTIQVPMPSFLTAITSFASRKEVESRQAAEYGELIDRIRALPGVIAAGASTVLPLGPLEVHTSVGFEDDPNPAQDHGAQLSAVSPDFFRAMGIPLLAGRAFTVADANGSPDVAIVNDVIARRYWPHESALGKHVNMSGLPRGPWYEVVGVVGATHRRTLEDAPQPEFYRPYRQYLGPAFGEVLVVRTTRDPAHLAPAIRALIHASYPNQPIGDIKLMTDVVATATSAPRLYTGLLTCFAALAMLLSAAGVYGVTSYSAAQRTRESGIRIALGATRANLLALMLRRTMIFVGAGVVLGVAGAMALTRLVRAQLYQTAPADPLTFLSVSLLLIAVAALAAYVPASRAARVDPMIALREE